MSSFNFNARYALLTYAQCGDLDPFAVATILQNWELSASWHVKIMLMAELTYTLLSISEGSIEQDELTLSMLAVITQTSHHLTAHLKRVSTIRSKMVMLSQGGLERPSRNSVSKTSDVWAEIILAESREEFFSLVSSLAPRALCTSFPSLSKYADWKYRVDPEPYRPDPQFVFDLTGAPELLDWSHDSLNTVRGVGTVSLLRWLSYPSLTRCDLVADAPAFQGDPPRRGPSTLQPARSRALVKESD